MNEYVKRSISYFLSLTIVTIVMIYTLDLPNDEEITNWYEVKVEYRKWNKMKFKLDLKIKLNLKLKLKLKSLLKLSQGIQCKSCFDANQLNSFQFSSISSELYLSKESDGLTQVKLPQSFTALAIPCFTPPFMNCTKSTFLPRAAFLRESLMIEE